MADEDTMSEEFNDVELEVESDAINLADPTDKLKKIKAKLKECEAERKEYLDGWQRAKADFVNYKRDVSERQRGLIQFANKNLVGELLVVLDGFYRAMSDKVAWESVDLNWRLGIEHIHSQFLDVLKSNGVEMIESTGKTFDPARHESVGEEEVDSKEKEGIILSETLQGYMMHGVVIRPAHVIIGKYE